MTALRSLDEVVSKVVAELPDNATDDDLVEAVRHTITLAEYEAWVQAALALAVTEALR